MAGGRCKSSHTLELTILWCAGLMVNVCKASQVERSERTDCDVVGSGNPDLQVKEGVPIVWRITAQVCDVMWCTVTALHTFTVLYWTVLWQPFKPVMWCANAVMCCASAVMCCASAVNRCYVPWCAVQVLWCAVQVMWYSLQALWCAVKVLWCAV